MAGMCYVCLYYSNLEALEPYDDSQRGRLMWAMLEFARDGKEPSFTGPEKFIWPTLREQILRDQDSYEEKCERNRRNALKRYEEPEEESCHGMPSHATACEDLPPSAKTAKEKKNTKKKEKEKERENTGPSGFTPPNAEEVRKFCQEENLSISPEAFVDYYAATGWCFHGSPIADWRSAARLWQERGEKHGEAVQEIGLPNLGGFSERGVEI